MIDICIHTQPDDESCGPTSLQAIYHYYGLDIPLEEVIHSVERSHSGGTLAPMLGKHALQQGFEATIYINSLNIFDPTWFEHGEADSKLILQKLTAQMRYKRKADILQASKAYMEYVLHGGTIRFRTLSVQLLKDYFKKKIPILTGLSATYLYRSARERYTSSGEAFYDDIRGTPCGHFVVLCGYDDRKRLIVVADPHRENPLSHDNYYKVSIHRLINAIMLGVLTYDANLLIIQPKSIPCKQ
ncbi:C39 family peptidase [Legionella spiritensis]|uniref:C39 family peptidase n=1 Tax=Legionella spiritensis TaxID=452 RepID=UPI000F6FBDD9|nr:C39 family peptidase [Legionella spiritensis]VEG91972.1 Peptidase C39 family [Legionella spiritensis]